MEETSGAKHITKITKDDSTSQERESEQIRKYKETINILEQELQSEQDENRQLQDIHIKDLKSLTVKLATSQFNKHTYKQEYEKKIETIKNEYSKERQKYIQECNLLKQGLEKAKQDLVKMENEKEEFVKMMIKEFEDFIQNRYPK